MKNRFVLLLGFAAFLSTRPGLAQFASNSDYYEARKLLYTLDYPATNKNVEKHLDRLDELLTRQDANSLNKFKQEAIKVLTAGCESGNFSRHCIFLRDKEPQREILELLEKHKIHPEGQLALAILDLGDRLNSDIFGEKNFMDYSLRYSDNLLQEKVFLALNGLDLDAVERYFKIFRYALAVFEPEPVTANFRNKYINSGRLTIGHIRKICAELNQIKDSARRQIFSELGDRVYNFPVADWIALGSETMVELAKYSSHPIRDYLDKIVNDLNSLLANRSDADGQLDLLVSFLQPAGTQNYRAVYERLRPYFENNVDRFLYLHGAHLGPYNSRPDLLSLLNENRDNLRSSMDVLAKFCAGSTNWSFELYTVAKNKYYPKSPDQVFDNLLKPIYQNLRNDDRVHQCFLWDVYQGNFLQKQQQLEVARYFLRKDLQQRLLIRDPSSDLSQERRNITFVTRLYLKYYDRELNKNETLFYLNSILPELTQRIAEQLFVDRVLIFGELRNILQTIEAIHQRFDDIDYRAIKALAGIHEKIKSEFERTLLDKVLPSEAKKLKLIDVIQLLIEIAGILNDESELSYIVEKLRVDIFDFDPRQPECQSMKLAEKQPENREMIFKSLDRNLREAALAVHNKAFFARLYTDFYLPLIRIEGFLDRIYEYDDSSSIRQRPYTSLLNELDSKDKEASFEVLNGLLACPASPNYLSIEASLQKFLFEYYQKLGRNLWENPQAFSFNINANIWVFKYLLEQKLIDNKLQEKYAYKELLEIFLAQLPNPPMTGKTNQDLRSLCQFVALRVLNPYELKTFPFFYRNRQIDFDKFIGPNNDIVGNVDIDQRKPIDGTYRLRLLELMQQRLSTSDLEDLKLHVDAALLLPNSKENNIGNALPPEGYFELKQRLFTATAQRLRQEPQIDVAYLIQLLRLEKSCRERKLGYEELQSSLMDRIPDEQDKVALIIEKLRLEMSEKRPSTLAGLENYFKELNLIVDDLRNFYKIPPFDPIEYAMRKLFEYLQDRGGFNRALKLHHLEQMYFLLAYFKNALAVANELATNPAHFDNTLNAYNDIIEVYNHFLPFMYDLDLDFITQQEHDILFLMLFDREIKSSLIDLRKRAQQKLARQDSLRFEQQYAKVVRYILTHNFANIEVVFKAVDNANLKIFEYDRQIEYQVFNFKYLYQVRETKQLNAKAFIDEAFGSFSENLKLITNVDDNVVWQYYFGDFRNEIFEGKLPSRTQLKLQIKCVDDAIRKMVELSLRSLPDKIKDHVENVIKNPIGVFTEGYRNLKTPAGMQKMWEAIVDKLGEKLDTESRFYMKYQNFYKNAMFDGQGDAAFRRDICVSYIEKLTNDKNLASQRQALFPALDSLKRAIHAYANKPFPYLESHRRAVVNLMRSTAVGEKLPPQVPYIMQEVYDNQRETVKVVSETMWNDPSLPLFDLYDWIYDGKKRYESVAEVEEVFFTNDIKEGKSFTAYFVRSVHKYVEEKEREYVERLKRINATTEKRITQLNSISQSLNQFQSSDEGEILKTYGKLVDLRRGHNQRVEKRTELKIAGVQATESEKTATKEFYYRLKVAEGDVEKYAKDWQYILCVLIPFSKYIGQSNLTLESVQPLLASQNIFKFYFFYFYRSYNDGKSTFKKYEQSYPGRNGSHVLNFFESELGFDYFDRVHESGEQASYMNGNYVFTRIRYPELQQEYIMVRSFQQYCSLNEQNPQKLKEHYEKRKLPLFYEVVNELEQVAANRPHKYLRLLYYVTHSFPYVAAYQSTQQAGALCLLEKYPGDISSASNLPTPFKRLHSIWQKASQRYRCLEMLDATLGAIFLGQADKVDISQRNYIQTTPGGLDFITRYKTIRGSLTRQNCLE